MDARKGPQTSLLSLPLRQRTAISSLRTTSVSSPQPLGSSSSATSTCLLCAKNESRYICPNCNVPYCSLACFKGEKHLKCSENFYRDSIAREIENDGKRTKEEKVAMMNILKKFEDASMTDSGSEGDGEEREVEIGEKTEEELLGMLSKEERERWERMLSGDSAGEEELQKLLEEEKEELEPWWVDDKEGKRPTLSPEGMDAILEREAPHLTYNILYVLLCYVYIHRSSPSPSLRLLRPLAPFLFSSTDRTLHGSLKFAISSFRSIAQITEDQLLHLLLTDLYRLLEQKERARRGLGEIWSWMIAEKRERERKKVEFFLGVLDGWKQQKWLEVRTELEEELELGKKGTKIEVLD
ncbi:hypothetical protein BT69DRAFT_1336974 [Atractiella rhizophila]|nr:hypothetical protein BT69DRAFT_1336974 [Atractiella rhizophila]